MTTSCPSTDSIPVVIEPLMDFWIYFLTSAVARGLTVFYRKSCFKSRMEKLRAASLMITFLTLRTDVLLSETRWTVARATHISMPTYENMQ